MRSEAINCHHHHVIHKIWGIHFGELACILPVGKMLKLRGNLVVQDGDNLKGGHSSSDHHPGQDRESQKYFLH
jgi:hypothetical protein